MVNFISDLEAKASVAWAEVLLLGGAGSGEERERESERGERPG